MGLLHCGHIVITEGVCGAGGGGGLVAKPYMKKINARSMNTAPRGIRIIVTNIRKPIMPRIIEPPTVPGLNYPSPKENRFSELISLATARVKRARARN